MINGPGTPQSSDSTANAVPAKLIFLFVFSILFIRSLAVAETATLFSPLIYQGVFFYFVLSLFPPIMPIKIHNFGAIHHWMFNASPPSAVPQFNIKNL
jgi:hypothetical protein